MGIIGKRFQDTVLRDKCIESGVMAEGSVASVHEGHSYNRAISLHKLTYEALIRVAWDGFYPWLDTTQPNLEQNIMTTIDDIGNLVSDICKKSNDKVFESPAFHQLYSIFTEYLDFL